MTESKKAAAFLSTEYFRDQYSKLRKSMKMEFYMEAIYLEYTLMEDYTELALHYAGMWNDYLKKHRGHEPMLDSKIRFIHSRAMEKKSMLNKYYNEELMDRLLSWRNERNKLLRAMQKENLTAEYLQRVAMSGKELADELKKRAASPKNSGNNN